MSLQYPVGMYCEHAILRTQLSEAATFHATQQVEMWESDLAENTTSTSQAETRARLNRDETALCMLVRARTLHLGIVVLCTVAC